jgi:hypothetical protein
MNDNPARLCAVVLSNLAAFQHHFDSILFVVLLQETRFN